MRSWNAFEHWHVRYRSPAKTMKGRAVARRFVPEGLPVIRNYGGRAYFRETGDQEFELLCPSDVLALLRAFHRREARPAFFEWVSLTEELKHRPPSCMLWEDDF